ncbi:MAG TPA: CBS domain-containing protein [Stellaceae bacterium]|nr:CBS domain-containing protein [Stellaceae bacterium]
MARVKEIMAREPVIVHVDHSLTEAATRMKEADVGALFVVDGDELVGVVTDRDLVIRGIAAGITPGSAPVIDTITRHVVFCHENSSLEDAAALMARQRIRRLAVVDDDRELVGVLSLGDLARSADVEPTALAAVLRAIGEPIAAAKLPAYEDPTGGRRRGSPPGSLHVYARRPSIRRNPLFET